MAIMLIFISADFIFLSAQEKKLKIEWDSVAGATGYAVEIKNSLEIIVIDQKTSEPLIEFSLTQGKYKLRIGAVNKFDKVSAWSDWEDISVEYAKDIKKKIEPCKPYPAIRLSAGWIMTQPLQPWDALLDFSFFGAGINLGFFYANGFWRHFGIELDVSYHYLQGKTLATTKMNNILIGGNIFLRTDFTIPVNLIIRGGGGVALSNLEYKNVFSGMQDKFWNYSPYYKIGAALEFKLYKNLFIETGLDYTEIIYGADFGTGNIRSFQYFVKAGYEFDIGRDGSSEVIKCDSGTAVKISIGYPFVQSLPLWENVYQGSFLGAAVNFALYGKHGFFKYVGFEIDSSYSYFMSKTTEYNFNQIMVGGNIFFRSAFNFPLNFIVRAGGGFVISILHQPAVFGGQIENRISYDPYWKAGISLEYEFVKPLFFEAGAEFVNIIYLGQQYYGMRYFMMFGVKLM
jgi:hypothetical protein